MVPDHASWDISFSYYVCNVTCKFLVLFTCIYMTWSERAETDDYEIISPNQYCVIRTHLLISMLFHSVSIVISYFSHLSYMELHTLPASLLPSIHTPDKSSLGRLRKHRSAVAIFYSQNKLKLLTYLLTYLLTPWSIVCLQKITSLQLVKKFPAFYGTWRFITAFTSVCHLSLSWASLIQSIPPHPTSWRSILILSSYLCLSLPSGLFPSGFPTKTLYMPLPLTCYMPHPSHSINWNYALKTVLTTWSS